MAITINTVQDFHNAVRLAGGNRVKLRCNRRVWTAEIHGTGQPVHGKDQTPEGALRITLKGLVERHVSG